jgi:hypothetical protein
MICTLYVLCDGVIWLGVVDRDRSRGMGRPQFIMTDFRRYRYREPQEKTRLVGHSL